MTQQPEKTYSIDDVVKIAGLSTQLGQELSMVWECGYNGSDTFRRLVRDMRDFPQIFEPILIEEAKKSEWVASYIQAYMTDVGFPITSDNAKGLMSYKFPPFLWNHQPDYSKVEKIEAKQP